jgi:transglutaminase-like putative cysteine protease
VRYEARATELPSGSELRLWIPIPSDDKHQRIRNIEVDAPYSYRITEEELHGNRMVHIEHVVDRPELAVTIEYDVDRWTYQTDLEAVSMDGDDDSRYDVYLEPSSLCVVNDEIRKIASELAAGRDSSLARARAFYDHVNEQMTYDKSGLGWGRGDTMYACEVGRGNCTDYHSYFISLCRAHKIPARFQIGLYGRYETELGGEYQTGGYHCWAEFRVPGKAWVPVDISEGDKDPSRRNYFFGAHSGNRVTLSTGRDLVLGPRQKGDPLNYFVNPYAEVDGKPFGGVTKKAFWRDVSGS